MSEFKTNDAFWSLIGRADLKEHIAKGIFFEAYRRKGLSPEIFDQVEFYYEDSYYCSNQAWELFFSLNPDIDKSVNYTALRAEKKVVIADGI